VLAYRTMRRNTLATTINLIGLSVALAVAIVCFVFVDRWMNVEDFHERADRIFVVGNTVDRDGAEQKWVSSPLPLGPTMQADLPQVEQAVRFMRYRTDVSAETPSGALLEDDEDVVLVDPAFLEVFSYPMLEGDTRALYDPNAVVITQAMATKYFGQKSPVGQTMTLAMRDQGEVAYTVRGVIDRRPLSSSIAFDVLVPFDAYRLLTSDATIMDDWWRSVTATFLLLASPADVTLIAEQMAPYLAQNNAQATEWVFTAFTFDNLRTLARIANDVRGEIAQGPPMAVFLLFGGISLLLLALACFNYVNVTLAATARRLNEIGIRKSMGGQRRQLVVQFIMENAVLCTLALAAGVVLAQAFFLPTFNGLVRGSLVIDYLGSGALWLFLIILLAVVARASGSYPALYISRFKPIDILRKQRVMGTTSGLLRGLLTLQFVVAFLTMFAGVTFVQNARFQQQHDWGYDKDDVVVIPLQDAAHYSPLADRLRQDANILEVTGTRHSVGENWGWATVETDGVQMESVRLDVGAGYPSAMSFQMLMGRSFDLTAPPADQVLVNEAMVEARGWSDPVGQMFRFDGDTYTVMGVVADFHYFTPNHAIRPLFIRPISEEAYGSLVVRTQPGASAEALSTIEQVWNAQHPEALFDGYLQSDVFDGYFTRNQRTIKVFAFTAVLALFLSVMGLFGLAAQHMARRRREIGIRKVLGAELGHVAVIVNKGFALMIVAAFAIALPIGYIGLDTLLNAFYALRMPVGLSTFAIAFVAVGPAAVRAVGIHFRSLAAMNPAEVLRAECCLLYTSPSPRDRTRARMPSSA